MKSGFRGTLADHIRDVASGREDAMAALRYGKGAPKGQIVRSTIELTKLFGQVRAAQGEIDAAHRRVRLNEAKKILNRIGDTKMTAAQIAANDREDKLDRGLIAKLEADMVTLSAAIKKARA